MCKERLPVGYEPLTFSGCQRGTSEGNPEEGRGEYVSGQIFPGIFGAARSRSPGRVYIGWKMGAEEGPSIKISVQPVRSNDEQRRCSRTAAVLGSKFSAIRYNPRVPGIQPVLVPVCTRYKWRTHPCSTLCTNITTSATMYLLNQVQKWNRGPHKKCAQATAYY